MIVKDNSRVYDTDLIIKQAEGQDVMDRAVYRTVFQLIYMRYIYVRSIVSGHCCTQPDIEEVKGELTHEDVMSRVIANYGYSEDEVNFYVDFTKRFNSLVR